MHTPWGQSDYSKQYRRGIIFYGTPGHGGLHVSAGLNKTIPDHLRRDDGWYEEDCDWARVVVAFPDLAPLMQLKPGQDVMEEAKQTLRSYYPEAYEKHFEVVLQPGESHTKDEKAFLLAHKDDYLVMSAFGDWHEKVPAGQVGCFAGRGGRLDNGQYPADCKWFLVPDAEYDARNFVIDPNRHPEIPSIS